jgi:ribonuclease R
MSILSHDFQGLAPAALFPKGSDLTVETLNRIVLEQFGIEDGFSKALLKEAEASALFYAANPGRRSDMRHLPFVTIDGADAKDFDDAVFAFADQSPDNPGGHYLYVAVADVAHFVRPGTLVDQEAYKRGFSVYLPNRAIPMLPPILSEDYCSLRPHEDRLAVVKCMRLSAEGEILDFHEERAVIQSRARLTYEQVDDYLCNSWHPRINEALYNNLDALHHAYQSLKEASLARDELNLEVCKTLANIDDLGRVADFTDVYKNDSRDLIEKMMIAAGSGAGQALSDYGSADVLYRVHGEPPQSRIAKVCGLRHNNDEITSLSSAELNDMLGRTTNSKYAASHMNATVLSILSRSRYSPQPRPHFGLALPLYAQVTSPIRRYADLIDQRGECYTYDLEAEGAASTDIDLNAAAAHLNIREEIVAKVHQEILQRCALAWLSGKAGQTVSAHIVTQNCQSIVLGINGCPIRLEAKPDTASRYGWATPSTYSHLRKWLDTATDSQKDHIPLTLNSACPLTASLSLDLKPWLQPQGPKQRILDICQ